MKATILLAAVLFCFSNQLIGQTRTINGRVISDELNVLPYVRIQTSDHLIVGTTDTAGRFKITIPQNTQTLIFGWLGYEQAVVKLNADCDTVEVVMMAEGTYDFTSSRKIDKLRLEQFNKLAGIHLEAYQKGVFLKESVCYSREFVPDKPALDSIEKEEIKEEKRIKLIFKKLNIGDTVKIPFSGSGGFHADGTDRTTLIYYSIFASMSHYDYTVKGVILSKNRHKRRYNLVFKITSCDLGKYPAVFQDRVLKIGEVITYNMRFFKILNK